MMPAFAEASRLLRYAPRRQGELIVQNPQRQESLDRRSLLILQPLADYV